MRKNSIRWLMASYIILNVMNYTVNGAMYLVIPLYALQFQATTFDIGMLRGASGLGTLLLIIPAGFLVDHFGSKRLFLLGSSAGILILLLLSLIKDTFPLTLLMVVSGLFNSLKTASLNSSYFRDLPAMGIEKSGWFKGSMSIGLTFTGPLLGGYLIRTITFDQIFHLLALIVIMPTALVFFFHNEPVCPGTLSELRESIRNQLQEFKKLLSRGSLYLPLITEILSTACFTTFSGFIAVIAVQSLRLQPADASMFITIEGGVFILTVFVAGPLVTLTPYFQIGLGSFAVTIIGLIGLSLADGFLTAALASAVLGLGLGFTNLMVSTHIGGMKEEKGKIVGLFAAAVGAGISLGPILGGIVGSYFGNHVIFVAFVPLYVGLALFVAIKEAQRKRSLGSNPL